MCAQAWFQTPRRWANELPHAPWHMSMCMDESCLSCASELSEAVHEFNTMGQNGRCDCQRTDTECTLVASTTAHLLRVQHSILAVQSLAAHSLAAQSSCSTEFFHYRIVVVHEVCSASG